MRIRQETDMERLSQGGVTAPKGFKAASAAAGIKYQGRTDMAIVMSEAPCVCAGTYTSNVVKAACVLWDKEITESGRPMQAVVVNSGIANACTGEEGFNACRKTAEAVTEALGILTYSPRYASRVIKKLLESAIANAENNNGMNRNNLYVAECYAGQGPTLKRIRPRAQGRAYRILHRTSNITVVLDER